MIVVDTSALLAMVFREEDAQAYVRRIKAADTVLIPSTVVVEAHIGARRRYGEPAIAKLATLLNQEGFQIVPMDAEIARLALDADRRYGRGADPRAKLNFGDLFPYALATQRGLLLLFKGNDFAATDVTPAL